MILIRNLLRKAFIKVLYKYYYGFTSWRGREQSNIFIIGHMRSGSSLLVQLLRGNKEILSLGESHLIYNDEEKLDHLYFKSLFFNNIFIPTRRYKHSLDKILHSHYLSKEYWWLLERFNIKIVFILREPSGSLYSLQNSLGLDFKKSEEHYVDRLKYITALSSYLKEKKQDYYYLTYDELTNKSEVKLHELSMYLQLDTPLKNTYNIHSTTGKKGFGDFSQNILSGEILKKNENYNKYQAPVYLNTTYSEVLKKLSCK